MDFLKNVGEKLSPDQPPMRQARELLDKAVNAVSAKDTEQHRLTLERLDKQDVWNDVFSTKLIEVLDKIDGIRTSVRTSLDQADTMRVDATRQLDELDSSVRSYADEMRAVQSSINDVNRRLKKAEAVSGSFPTLRRALGVLACVSGLLGIGTVWSLWIASRTTVLEWIPIVVTGLIVVATALFVRSTSRET